MKHWTEVDFQNWLYGLKEADAHADECAECRAEMERLQQARRAVGEEPEVSQDFLAAQRRSIYTRLEDAPRRNFHAWRWVFSTAMLLALVFGLTLPRWHKSAPPISDEQLFSDLAAMEQSAEPKAIQPMHSLFEP
jgi:ferric-dicitrate binding protein FerR (iron transport regulator)